MRTLVTSVLAAAIASSVAASSLVSPRAIPAPESLTFKVAADMNGDGIDDVVAMSGLQTTSVYLSDGNGGLTRTSTTTLGEPVTLAAGDLDGDKRTDVAVATFSGLTIARGDGRGGLTEVSRTALPSQPFQVTLVDLDRDGKLDAVVTIFASIETNNRLALFYGRGDATFDAPSFVAAPKVAQVTVGDVNGDGYPDLVAHGTSATLFMNDGKRSFVAQQFSTQSIDDAAAADVDGDGRAEIVISTSGGVRAVGYANGVFTTLPQLLTSGSGWVQPTDVNGDGRVDLLLSFDYLTTVYVSGTDGTFRRAASFDVLNYPAYGHFVREDAVDLVSTAQGRFLYIARGRADGTSDMPSAYAVTTSSQPIRDVHPVATADFDGDGFGDVANGEPQSQITIRRGSSSGLLGDPVRYPIGGIPIAIAAPDVDGDRRPDIIAGIQGTAELVLLRNRRDGTFAPATRIAAPANFTTRSIAIADVNGDGRADVVTTAASGSAAPMSAIIFIGNGDGTFRTSVAPVGGIDLSDAAAADFDGDGKSDLIVVGTASENVRFNFLKGHGDGTFDAAQPTPGGFRAGNLAVGDFDRDGRPDFAMTNNGGVFVYVNDGGGAFRVTAQMADFSDLGAGIVAADFNADGTIDLVALARATNTFLFYAGNGDGTFAAGDRRIAGSLPHHLAVADFNGDSLPDLAIGNDTGPLTTVMNRASIARRRTATH